MFSYFQRQHGGQDRFDCSDSCEEHQNYKWLFGILLSRRFLLSTTPVFSDRHAGILAAAEALSIRLFFCTQHIIGNMRANKAIKLQVSQEAYVGGAQASTLKAGCDKCLKMLEGVNINAAQYLKALSPEQWALYPHHVSTSLYGWRSTNFVESEQSRSLRLKPPKWLPFEYFRAYSKILMSEGFKRISQAEGWATSGRAVTPRADTKLKLELKKIQEYAIAFSTSTICYVIYRSSTRESSIKVHLEPSFSPV